ncbi:hypothetical protein DSM25559_0251 [Agrobacterium rosae]|uniref:Uncharacterized protein n=1 Tax=Agrobacterium rosae TaxID=1972867 RepID=A0A1R3T7T5_9HYPH|nr:hypothetical protein DSM25559_0251 [Agrobacterium rosae]
MMITNAGGTTRENKTLQEVTDALFKRGTGQFWAASGAVIHRMRDRVMIGTVASSYNGELPTGQTWVEQQMPATLAAS